MKSRAQLLRDAKTGNLFLQMTERYGKAPNQEMAKKRKVVNSNTANLMIETERGTISYLQLPKAALIEYTDNELIIYTYGYRKPNDKEIKILNAWNKIENTEDYQNKLNADILSDGSSSYWQKKKFFRENNAEYLMGFERQKGCCLDFNKKNEGSPEFISDESVKGEPILKYKVYME